MEQGKSLAASSSPLVDFDAVCRKVRAALEPARCHAVSLHDERGDVLWLSEGSMGPDEHNAVREAIDAFADAGAAPLLAVDLGDSRHAVLIRTVDARRSMVGVAMIVMDSRSVGSSPAKLLTPKLQRVLLEFSVMRGERVPRAAAARDTQAAPGKPRSERPVTPEIDRLHAALRRSPIALHVQRLVPLSKGGRLRRYEVLLRSKTENAPNIAPAAMLKAAIDNGLGSMIDRRVVTELIGWLVHHPDVWKNNEAMFSVNLTSTALHDEHFIKFVELCLAKSSLGKGTIAFEVDAPTALTLAGKIKTVADALHRLGCPLVLDDFSLRTECFALLRLPGVRYVKLAPEVTGKMRTDKISQAAIAAVVQMARVLGMHTVAKRTETAAEQEWLTALGVDFVQSNALSPPVSIDSLHQPNPARLN